MTHKSWDDLLAEGERLKVMEERIDAEAGNVRWLWGDLALEVAPMGADKTNNGAMEKLRRFADELDVSFESLRSYRTVAEKWPHGERSPSQPWIIHQQIMGRADRWELISNPVDVRTGEKLDRWTYRGMQRYLGNKPSPHYTAPPSTTDEKVEAAKALLEDPAVKAEVRRSLREEAEEQFPRPERRSAAKSDDPDQWTPDQWAAFDAKVVAATSVILTAFNLQQRCGYQPSVAATALLSLIKPSDIDGELQALLEEHS